MTDRLDELFADLRAGVLPEVRPPGVAAARRTVRRRRMAVSAAAVVAGAVVAGAVAALAGAGLLHQDRPEMSGLWSGQAVNAVRVVGPEWRDEPVEVLSGTGPDELRATRQVVGGYFSATIACAGHGYVTVTLSAGPGPTNSSTVAVKCDASVRPVMTLLTVPGLKGTVDVRVLPDDSAYAGMAVAYRLERE